jgi:hypothetical protein
VTLRLLKNAQFGESTHMVVVAGQRDHPLDPDRWWCDYVAQVPYPPPPGGCGLWVHGGWSVCPHGAR